METKQTLGSEPTPELNVDKIRRDVDDAYDDLLAAAGTIQSGAVTSGEAHPDRVATEPQTTNGSPSKLPTSPAVIGAAQHMTGEGTYTGQAELAGPSKLIEQSPATPPVIGPPIQPDLHSHRGHAT